MYRLISVRLGNRGIVLICRAPLFINKLSEPDCFSFSMGDLEEPILIVLDNHYKQVKLAVYTYYKENNITLLSLPPHRMQSLDVTFLGSLRRYIIANVACI